MGGGSGGRLPEPPGAVPNEHHSSPCSPAGVPSRMVPAQQAQRGGLLPHGLQHHHALSPAQGTVLASLPSLPTLIERVPGFPCLTQSPGPRGGRAASGWEGWRRPPQGEVFDLGLSLLCGVTWERHSSRRTCRQGQAWETIAHFGRLRQEWLGCLGIGGRPFGKTSQGQVTGLAAAEGELDPLAWRSLTLRCHWEQSQPGLLASRFATQGVLNYVTIYYPHRFVVRKVFQISKSYKCIIATFRGVLG